jgi:hypothetical protein
VDVDRSQRLKELERKSAWLHNPVLRPSLNKLIVN